MRTKRRRESAWGRVGRGMAWVARVVLAACLVAWGVAFAIQDGGGRVEAVARGAEGVAAVVRPVIRVAGAVALWLAGWCAVANWVLVVGNWKGKTRASLVPVVGLLLGGFAWWAAPEGSVWRGVAVAVVVLDPGMWMIGLAAAEDVARRVFGRGGGHEGRPAKRGRGRSRRNDETGRRGDGALCNDNRDKRDRNGG